MAFWDRFLKKKTTTPVVIVQQEITTPVGLSEETVQASGYIVKNLFDRAKSGKIKSIGELFNEAAKLVEQEEKKVQDKKQLTDGSDKDKS